MVASATGTFDLERRLGRLRQGDGARGRVDAHPAPGGDGAHRTVGLRQVDAAALPEPHERRDRQRDGRRQGPARRRRHQRARRRSGRAADAGGHGLPAAQPVPDDHLRQRRLRAADPRHPQARRARRPRRGVADARGALGRGEGVAQEARVRALGRAAAAAVHRARAGDAARGAADGRARLGARPDLDAADRGHDRRAQAVGHDRHRHAQHAAGGAHLRPDRVHAARVDGDAGARSSRWARPSRCSPTPHDKRTEAYITGRFG